MDLPSSQEGWTSERVMSTISEHALAQWGSNEAAMAIAEHVVRCEDIYMFTADGRKLIDFNSQAVCTNLGYSCPEIAEAVYDQMKNAVPMAESRWYITTVRAKVIDRLRQKMPHLDRFYFCESGATAVEASIRVARAFTGRPIVLTSSRSYHGSTAGALTATGGADDRHTFANFGFMENIVQFVDHAPFYMEWGASGVPDGDESVDRFLSYLEEMINIQGLNRVAAILLETMIGTQGAVPSPSRYLLGVQALCRKYGCLLILDEVMGGFGRTGKWFAYQHFPGLEPDIVTIAKGLTNAFSPLGGVCVTKGVGDHFNKNPVPIGSTYNSHPTGLAAAWASLQLYDQRNIMAHVEQVAPVFTQCFDQLKVKYPQLVQAGRSFGLHGALEVKIPGPESPLHGPCVAAANAVLKGRLITLCKYHRHMKALYVMCNPPLCITAQQLQEAFVILEEMLQAVQRVLAAA